MRLEQLKHFITIADLGSMNKAAELLFVSQPNISRSMSTLEEEVGKKLFVRHNHGVSVTKAGESFYFYAKSILGQMEAIKQLKDYTEQEFISYLKVSVAHLFLQDDLMHQYCANAKNDKKIIHLHESNIEGVLKNVRTLESEIGIVVLSDFQITAFRKVVELQELDVEKLGESPIYVHINKKNELANKQEIRMKELFPYSLICIPKDFFSQFNDTIEVENVALNDFTKVLYMNNYHSILNMLNHTESFLFGSKWQIDKLENSGVASIPLAKVDFKYHFFLIKRKKEILSEEAHIFIKMLKESYENL